MTILVSSFDMDGCLFHRGYTKSDGTTKSVVAHNQLLLDGIKERSQDYSKHYVFIGSNRQSFFIDVQNRIGKGSCFPAIEQVSSHLNATLDTLLLADIHSGYPAGYAFEKAISHGEDFAFNHPKWIFDESKITVLHAQMQKTANEHPGEEIVFEFYDDRAEILDGLTTYYTKHDTLVPSNVTLHLHPYPDTGKRPKGAYVPIKGTGIIDSNYVETVRQMAAIAAKQTDAYKDVELVDGLIPPAEIIELQAINTRHVSPDLLTKRRGLNGASVLTSTANQNSESDTDDEFDCLSSDSESLNAEIEETGVLDLLSASQSDKAATPVLSDTEPALPDSVIQCVVMDHPEHNEATKDEWEIDLEKITPVLLDQKPCPALEPRIQTQAQKNFVEELHNILALSIQLRLRGHLKAASVANNLHKTLKSAWEQYEHHTIDKTTFAKKCGIAIKTALPELASHRGWKNVYYNLGLALIGLGFLYLVAALYNHQKTGNFFFQSETNSVKSIHRLQNRVPLIDSPDPVVAATISAG